MLPKKYQVAERFCGVFFCISGVLSESSGRQGLAEGGRGWKAWVSVSEGLCAGRLLCILGSGEGEVVRGMRGGKLRRPPGQWGKAASENKWELTADADSSASCSWQ